MDTSSVSMGNSRLGWPWSSRPTIGLEKTNSTLAKSEGDLACAPAKITSSMDPPRRLFAERSPSTHFNASTTFDLPHPLGPTMPLMGASKRTSVASAKLLNPESVSRSRRMAGEDLLVFTFLWSVTSPRQARIVPSSRGERIEIRTIRGWWDRLEIFGWCHWCGCRLGWFGQFS